MAAWSRWLVVVSMAFPLGCASYDKVGASAPQVYALGGLRAESMGDGDSVDSAAPEMPSLPAMDMPPMEPAPAPMQGKSASGSGSAIDDPERKQPILIYTAEFTMSVYEVEKSLNIVEGLAKDAGGFLSRREDRLVTIRVPAQKFQEVVLAIEKVGDVLHRNVVSEDVTAEYRDLEVQLQNALAMRARFEKLLEKATKVEEALAIERELGRITGDIERFKGRLKLLGDQARYSTITVNFAPRNSEQVQQGPFVLPLPWLNNVSLPRLLAL